MKCDRYGRYVRVSKTSFIMTSILYVGTRVGMEYWRMEKLLLVRAGYVGSMMAGEVSAITEISPTLVVKFITRTTDLNFTGKHDYPFFDGWIILFQLYTFISRLIICVYIWKKKNIEGNIRNQVVEKHKCIRHRKNILEEQICL